MLAMAEACDGDDEKAAMVATLLEGLLSELSARASRPEAGARRPSELPFRSGRSARDA